MGRTYRSLVQAPNVHQGLWQGSKRGSMICHSCVNIFNHVRRTQNSQVEFDFPTILSIPQKLGHNAFTSGILHKIAKLIAGCSKLRILEMVVVIKRSEGEAFIQVGEVEKEVVGRAEIWVVADFRRRLGVIYNENQIISYELRLNLVFASSARCSILRETYGSGAPPPSLTPLRSFADITLTCNTPFAASKGPG